MDPTPILGCALNLSDGRHAGFLARVREEAASATQVLDLSSDPDHNRTVLTMCGAPDPLVEAVVRVAALAAAHIDLRTHTGVHPRTGAIDVVPFYPLRSATMAIAVSAARACATRLWEELRIPSFFYEEAAPTLQAGSLPGIRKTAFSGRSPDTGGPGPHPTAGAAVVGARGLLVAYNVDLATPDLAIARQVATAVRLRCAGRARTLGLYLPGRGSTQVSMNIVRPERLTLGEAFDTVADEAGVRGVEVAGSEIVGLVPRACLGGDLARLNLRQAPLVLEDLLERWFAA